MGAVQTCAAERVQDAHDCVHQATATGDLCDANFDRRLLNVQLLAGARDGEEPVVREALKGGANPETRTPMRISVTGGFDVVGKVKKEKKRGPTPLMLAAKSGSVGCVKALLSAGAKLEAKDEDGMRPLHFAALSAELAALEVLLAEGASPDALDANKRGVLDHLPADVRRSRPELRKWEEALRAAGGSPAQASLPGTAQLPLTPPEPRPEADGDEDNAGDEGPRAGPMSPPSPLLPTSGQTPPSAYSGSPASLIGPDEFANRPLRRV